jgi:hypothetical protein
MLLYLQLWKKWEDLNNGNQQLNACLGNGVYFLQRKQHIMEVLSFTPVSAVSTTYAILQKTTSYQTGLYMCRLCCTKACMGMSTIIYLMLSKCGIGCFFIMDFSFSFLNERRFAEGN